MNELLKLLVSLSLSGSLLIAVLLACKPLVKDRLSKRWQYYIWLVVVARLLIPFGPEASLMGNVFAHLDGAALLTAGTQAPALPEAAEADAPQGSDSAAAPQTAAPPHSTPSRTAVPLGSVCLLAWLVVAAGLMIRKVTVYQSFVKYIKAGRTEIPDMAHWERLGALAERAGVKSAVDLSTNSLISSPLLIGFFRPRIMLPTTEVPEADFTYTILHELTHYKRRDMFYKWLVQAAVCLHWFNPLVYVMAREVDRACELSCDEAVIGPLDGQGRRAYGDTLLNAAGTGGPYKDSLACVTLHESKKRLKERLDAIMGFREKTRATTAFSAALALALCFGATYAGAYGVRMPQATAGSLGQAATGAEGSGADSARIIAPPAAASSEAPQADLGAPDRVTPEQADEMALALTDRMWVWDWVAFFVPYMSEEGAAQIVPASRDSEWAGTLAYNTMTAMEPFTQAQVDGARSAAPEKAYLTKADIDAHARMIMESNGQWECVEMMLPYMSENGVKQVEKIYAEKRGLR